MATLDSSLRGVVGGRTATALTNHLGLETVGDLLHYYPRRYQQRGELTDLGHLAAGEYATVFAEVVRTSTRQIRGNLRKTDVVVTDGKRTFTLPFFNLKAWQLNQFVPGVRAFFSGKVDEFRGRPQLTHPQYEFVDDEGADGAYAGALIPIYPATKEASSRKIWVAACLALDAADLPDDPLPDDVRQRHGLIGLREAFEGMHRPVSLEDQSRARQRLAWEEAFVLQTAMAQRRAAAVGWPATPRPRRRGGLLDAFDARLPFELTAGQVAVIEVIEAEIARPHPMHRLLQGEVGSGKTVVALRAMLAVVDAGGQGALLAPTEVLAQQHLRSITAMLGPLALGGQLGAADHATRVVLLTGSMSQNARRTALLDAASGEAGIVIGTHALLQENVQFADLGFVVVDEQHRFGVEQRDALRGKARDELRPHVLVMTATPIPRTIAMTVYGDLEVSTLDEVPKGRPAVSTFVAPLAEKPGWQDRVWQRVREEVEAGHQAYVVCPRIGGDEADDDVEPSASQDAAGSAVDPDGEVEAAAPDGPTPARRAALAVLDVVPMLVSGPLAGLRVEMLHGRMPSDDKDAVMRAFAAGEIDVLVATTVIEVGVDVANATAMVVVDADWFGMSQLHQLRGRVGRGEAASICLLLTQAAPGSPARDRLEAVAATSDGFRLSELDLEQRREGTILNTQQHGRSDLALLSLVRDRRLIEQARDEASRIVAADPALQAQPALAAAVARLWADARTQFLEKA